MRSGAHKKAPAHTANDLNTTECLGATTLLGLLKNYARSVSGDMKKSITVGIIGLPNVGKSSLINRSDI
jgi:nuclear GTP-binding protein